MKPLARLALSVFGVATALLAPCAFASNILSNEWTLVISSYVDSAPAVGGDGTIYFGTWKGQLWALNPDGTRKWVFGADNEIRSSPAVTPDSTVYFGCRDRKFYSIRADGRKRWEFRTGGWVDSSPALGRDGAVCFGSWDKSFYALSADGAKLWEFNTAGPIVSSPAIGIDGTIYFGSHDRKVYALAPDGRKKWEFGTGGPIISSPALNGDQCLYITSVDGFLHAINLDGTLRWRLHTGGINESSPVIGSDGTVYAGVLGRLWAVGADGKKQWGLAGGEDVLMECTPFVLADGTIGCVAGNNVLWYASPKGDIQGMYWPAGAHGSPAIGPTGAIYTPGFGDFNAVRAGAALAQTPWPKFRGNSRNTGNLQDLGR